MPSVIHWPGTAWHSVRTRACGSISGRSVTAVSCQKLPPTSVRWSGVDDADPDEPELGIGTTDDHRGAGRQACLIRCSRRERPDHATGLEDLGHDRGRQTDEVQQLMRPGPTGKVEQAGTRAGAGIGHEAAGESIEDPVAQHPDVRHRVEELGLDAPGSSGTAQAT